MHQNAEKEFSAAVGTKGNKERIHFRATAKMVSMLSELKNLHGISMSDSIRKGVALFSVAKRGEAKNQRLALVNKDGSIATEIELI